MAARDYKLSVVDVLQTINDGGTIEELRDQLAVAVKQVQFVGKPAKVSLELTISPNGANQVSIGDKVVSKLPVAVHAESNFYICEDGSLSRKNPAQFSMLQELEENKGA